MRSFLYISLLFFLIAEGCRPRSGSHESNISKKQEVLKANTPELASATSSKVDDEKDQEFLSCDDYRALRVTEVPPEFEKAEPPKILSVNLTNDSPPRLDLTTSNAYDSVYISICSLESVECSL